MESIVQLNELQKKYNNGKLNNEQVKDELLDILMYTHNQPDIYIDYEPINEVLFSISDYSKDELNFIINTLRDSLDDAMYIIYEDLKKYCLMLKQKKQKLSIIFEKITNYIGDMLPSHNEEEERIQGIEDYLEDGILTITTKIGFYQLKMTKMIQIIEDILRNDDEEISLLKEIINEIKFMLFEVNDYITTLKDFAETDPKYLRYNFF